MSLIAGNDLDPALFFAADPVKAGKPTKRGSSFELTVGTIIDSNGKVVDIDSKDKPDAPPYKLEPGHMVQIVSAEFFNLPDNVTGHVTYKTGLTKIGIWALTIGIVDPGWKGPVTTTLLNYSKKDFEISKGDTFLRVSLFRHVAIPPAFLPQDPSGSYLSASKKDAMRFPSTFLDHEDIATKAGLTAFDKMQSRAFSWIAGIAFIFTIVSLIFGLFQYWSNSAYRGSVIQASDELGRMRAKLELLDARLTKLEATQPPVSPQTKIPQ